MREDKVYVETVYTPDHMREPNISEYNSVAEAESFINTCLEWGIGIVSCEIVNPTLLESDPQ